MSAGSDLLVKVNVAGRGKLSFTVDDDTTRYIDLNDPANPATAGANAGKNPQGIAVNKHGHAGLRHELRLAQRARRQPDPGPRGQGRSAPRRSRRPARSRRSCWSARRCSSPRAATSTGRPGTTVSTDERLSSEGWQNCASCHFKGLTDGIVWSFNDGPRKSVPLNATFNPSNPDDQRVLNYSSICDEVEDFELNIRNVSGPGPLAAAQTCATPGAAGHQRVRPGARAPDRRHRRPQPGAVHHQQLRPEERRPPADDGHAAGQHGRRAGADRDARVGAPRRPHAERPAARRAEPAGREPGPGRPGPRAVRPGVLRAATAAPSGRAARSTSRRRPPRRSS